ncbi:MAG: oligoendopeptidase F [Lachnospiraceae bacterium]|nr:oligoendopeptidase F [Lachnospiraceae bacterium]
MTETLKERKDMDPRFMWDLTKLYADDEAWEKAFAEIDPLIDAVAEMAGTLSDAGHILEYFRRSTALERTLSNLFEYASLRRSGDTRETAAQSMYARVYGKYVNAVTASSFAEPEFLALPEEEIRKITEDPSLTEFSFALKLIAERKPHTLSAGEEMLLASFGEVFAAPGQIAENLQDADMTFSPVKDAEGKEHELTDSNFILLQNSEDRVLRENAFRSYYAGYKGHINTFGAAYSGAVKAAAVEAAARHYGSSREMAMAAEHVPMEVYDNLIAAVRKFMPAMYRYVALRKKILGVDELHYYDVYTPLVQGSTKTYTYEEAQEMILSAVEPLGEEYGRVVRQAFAERWIDVYPNRGKTGGAFSAGTYDSVPYILTNYTGTLNSVSALAHEMGHSMHTWHANRQQPPQYAGYTLFVAEVASTVNENLLVEKLLEGTQDPRERLLYLNEYMEGFKGTVYRQTMFAEFEKEAHAMAERGEALTPEALCGVYRQLVSDYFGPDLVPDEEVQYEWARIPHFYSPFYVFKYATSYCASAAVSEAVRTEGDAAAKPYLEFLSMGGSALPLDELKHAGVDLSTPAPIERALSKFERIVEEAEKTYEMIAGAE